MTPDTFTAIGIVLVSWILADVLPKMNSKIGRVPQLLRIVFAIGMACLYWGLR